MVVKSRQGVWMSGEDQTVEGIKNAADGMSAAVLQAIRNEADRQLVEAKANTPVSIDGSHGNPPGFLRDSGRVRKVRATLAVDITFTAPYAVYVHEGVGLNFRVGKAKFLEDVTKEAEAGYVDRLAADAAAIFKRKRK